MECLAEYRSPRSKVTHLLRNGDIIRVRKGLYVFGPEHRRSPVSLELLANLIYGPSYVSLEYALAYYGLIPEYVVEVTSVTSKRRKMYETPIGRFSYMPIPTTLFSVGFTLHEVSNSVSALIATPEKAFADMLYKRNAHITTNTELEALLFDDLRLDETGLKKMRIGILQTILTAGGSPILSLFINWLRSKK